MASPAHPDESYFAHARTEIDPLLPARASRVLEIGCGSGATLGWLAQRWPDAELWGVDGHAPLEPLIRARAGHALIHDLEQPLPALGSFDLILALDVLEHLRAPEAVLADLATRLRPGGVCIVSVPNIASYQIIAPLLVQRRFAYTDAGPMDRTHLRWFTEESALALMAQAGLGVTAGVMTGFTSGRRRLADWLSLGLLRHYLAVQYVMRAERGAARRRPHWQRDQQRRLA
ncbi:MAG: class I SAM-dependent methyltransferase [Chakrabartia sp.]